MRTQQRAWPRARQPYPLPTERPPVHTGTLSAERLAVKALEARLLGGERKLRRREVAAGAGSVASVRAEAVAGPGFPELRRR